MNYVAVTPFYAAGLPTGLALLQNGEIRGYVASDNRRSSFTQHLLSRIEGCAERSGVVLWSSQQLKLLDRLMGRPVSGHYIFLEDLLIQTGHCSLGPSYSAIRLGLGEPGEDALAQAFCLKWLHDRLPPHNAGSHQGAYRAPLLQAAGFTGQSAQATD